MTRSAPSLRARTIEQRQLRVALWEQSTMGTHDTANSNMLFPFDPNEKMIQAGRPPDPMSEYRPMRRSESDIPSADLLRFVDGRRFKTILADPPWRFINRTGKIAPEHRRLSRYGTLTVEQIGALPVVNLAEDTAHLYLWVPNALLPEGLQVMRAWGFAYKSNVVWHKLRKDGALMAAA
jgi:hypothetical protein